MRTPFDDYIRAVRPLQRTATKQRVITLLRQGLQPKAICIEVGKSPSYVSNIGQSAGFHFTPGQYSKRIILRV